MICRVHWARLGERRITD